MVENKERKSTKLLFWSWGHDLAKKALTIRDLVHLARTSLANSSPDLDLIDSRLDKIDRLSSEIMGTPLPFDLEHVPVNSLVQELVEWLGSLEFYRNVVFHVDLDPNQPAVTANSAWLRRTLEILIENAAEAMSKSPNPQITVSTRVDGAGVTIAVEDKGEGIEREPLSAILRSPPILQPGGKGRGLYIARLAVELYDGAMEIDTSPTGTSVTTWLPLVGEVARSNEHD